MSVEVSFWVLGVLAIAAVIYGQVRYRNPLNPLTVFAVAEVGLFTIFSAVMTRFNLSRFRYDDGDMVKTVGISMVYLAGFVSPFLFHGSRPSNLFAKMLRLLGLGAQKIASRFSPFRFAVLLGAAIGAFWMMAEFGEGGILWLTDPRVAYLFYRTGVGPFYALTQWFSTFALFYYLWSRKPRALELLLAVALFSAGSYFLGSKNHVLVPLVVGIAYYHFCVRRIPLKVFLVFPPLLFSAPLALSVAYGAFPSVSELLNYFTDYFATTLIFISRFDEFGFRYGSAMASSLWFYVPRWFYPDKPYEFGITLIHRVLFPQMAALGHTPGILPWSIAYFDFGVVGVFAAGMWEGILRRMAYEHFLGNKRSFFAFLFMVQLSLWPVFSFSPLVIFVAWNVAQAFFLRLRVLSRSRLGQPVLAAKRVRSDVT